jgi:hypothetical protein
LKVNGEAIYGSTYFTTHEEGDLRSRGKANTLYAIALEWPEEAIVALKSLAGKKATRCWARPGEVVADRRRA